MEFVICLFIFLFVHFNVSGKSSSQITPSIYTSNYDLKKNCCDVVQFFGETGARELAIQCLIIANRLEAFGYFFKRRDSGGSIDARLFKICQHSYSVFIFW